ncbi:glutamine--tRNA ligase/YqeY domain fusion protein [Clostridium sp.]|uniref:glutamine--tRNA ligase/YqeY domain fusion protein n=1 Tax=Clostridium sp. TaxID=1506 RepID=UPI003464844D
MCNEGKVLNFIDKIVGKELEENIVKKVHTRFPPEPNGYLHIGSAYAINVSYALAKKYNGEFNLRFDDTNPAKEDVEYEKAIIEDMKWLGVDYGKEPYYGSDYSEGIFNYAKYLINEGKAYVCDLSQEEIREYKGTLTTKGKESPFRNRTIEENLDLFNRMKNGEFQEGEKVLRAKIDMESPNISLRDPVIYRILHLNHYRTGDKWCIYPMYDFAHPIQDYIEGITHSLCSDEFKNHRPLYEWVLKELDLEGVIPRQIEFGRMNLSGVVTSKRYLKELVSKEYVNGWDDPRLPTLKGLRRRGYTKEAIFSFLDEIGVSRVENTFHVSILENSLRQDLKDKVKGIMAVFNPLKVVITNLDESHLEYLEAENNTSNISLGVRKMPFTRELYIEREDFSDNPPKGYKRLVLGGEVRLKHGYFIKCNEVIRDNFGEIVELICTYDPETKSGSGFTARKVKGTIHWVSVDKAIPSEVRLYEDLFLEEFCEDNFLNSVNKKSLKIIEKAFLEPAIRDLVDEERFQFIRHGYFIIDSKDSKEDNLVFNRIVSLKSSYKE